MASPTISTPKTLGARAVNIELLRTSTLRNQALHLREILSNHPSDTLDITNQLITYVALDYLPVIVVSIWVSVCHDPYATVAVLRQQHNVVAQRFAIHKLAKYFRSEKTFAAAWEAGGGAAGYAQIMSNLSVYNLQLLCKKIKSTAMAMQVREERRGAFTELLRILWRNIENDGKVGAVLDPRPLRKAYSFIASACGGEVMLEWRDKTALSVSYHADPEFFEKYVLDKLQSEGSDPKSWLQAASILAQRNLEFALFLLEKWLESESLVFPADKFLTMFLIPITKSCSTKRRIGSEIHTRLWGLIPRYLQKYPRSIMRQYGVYFSKLMFYCTKAWAHSPESFTDTFTKTIGLMDEKHIGEFDLLKLLGAARPALRYELLRLFLKHGQGRAFDIGPVENKDLDCSTMKARGMKWPTGILCLLPPHEGLSLLEKLWEGYPGSVFPGGVSSSSLFRKYDPGNDKCSDHAILRALLIRQSESDNIVLPIDPKAVLDSLRLTELPRRMKEATQGREPGDRARWAIAAINLSVALGDLDLYDETLRWARRFNKDSRATHVIYDSSFISDEAVELLSGLPLKLGSSTKQPSTEDIEARNKVLKNLVETAILATPNPDFSLHSFRSIFKLIDRVVKSRAARIDQYQDHFKLLDDDLFDIVWKPTIDMLLEVEKAILEPANKKLYLGSEGLLSYWNSDIGCQRGSVIRFFDTLAKARDQIWQQYRISQHPSVATLPDPFPRGLTLEILLPFDRRSSANLPYLHARAEALVFVSPEVALVLNEENEEIDVAVGEFLDDWCIALKLYLLQPDGEMNRMDRIDKAWNYATGTLSKDRMSEEEAVRYWTPLFKRAGLSNEELDSYRTVQKYSAPSVPAMDDVDQPIDWSPNPNFQKPIKEKKLVPTYLDAITRKGSARRAHPLRDPKAVIPAGPDPPQFWHLSSAMRREFTTAEVDSYIVAGILAINSTHGGDSSLLLQPFPDAVAPRFPALYLDQDFLERDCNKNQSSIVNLLETLDVCTPPKLLSRLASSLLEKIRKETREGNKPYHQFANIIKLLSKSGNPSLASPLIQEFILEETEASSWHREVFGVRHMNTLPPSQVQSFFQEFSAAIVKKLEVASEKAKEAAKTKDNQGTARGKPVIKVTTVKMLAQLVHSAAFIGPESAVDVLIGLLKSSSNLSICLAVVDALIEAGSATNTNDPNLRRKILDALQRYAGPRASSINENHGITDWEKAESDGQLPEVWHYYGQPDLLKAFIKIGTKDAWPGVESRALAELRCSILLASADNNQRWMRLFLKTNGFKLPDGYQMPAVPLHREALPDAFAECSPHISRNLFESMIQYFLLNINRPEWLVTINKKIKDDPVLSGSNAGKHWLALWDIDTSSLYYQAGLSWLANALDLDLRNDVYPDNATHDMLEEAVFTIADTLLAISNHNWFSIFMGGVACDTWKTKEGDSRPHMEDRRRCLRQIIDKVEGFRTPEWQSNPKRHPKFLPNVFSLELKVRLPKAIINKSPMSAEEVVKVGDEILKVLKDILSSTLPYTKDFQCLYDHLRGIKPAAELAVMLGSIPMQAEPETVTLLDHLLVELAGRLLQPYDLSTDRFMEFDQELVKRLDMMLETWQISRVENFRTIARKINENEAFPDEGFGLFD